MSKTQIEDIDPELGELLNENSKLKYRLDMLKRSIKEVESYSEHLNLKSFKIDDDEKYLINLVFTLEKLFEHSIFKSFPQLKEAFSAVKPSNFADYQCNSSMKLSKTLKDEHGLILKPNEIAVEIQKNLSGCFDFIEKNEIKPNSPPFININLKKEYLEKKIIDLLRNGINIKPIDNVNKVVIDYSSPNVAKEMHVGHLRSTIIGDCLSNIFEYLGQKVLRLNHVGDWGTQFGMLLSHLVDKYPDFQTNMPAIGDLQIFYKESKLRFDSDAEFKKKAYETVSKLQNKDEKIYSAWKLICDISRQEFNYIYKELDINNLIERGESFYQDYMVKLMNELREKNILIEDEGRKILWPKNADHSKSIPLTLIKSDGAFTYDTSDLACIKQRIEEEKANRIIYVTDEGQQPHFQILFEVAKDLGFFEGNNVKAEHVGFGVVLGEDKKKFKTRSGTTVRLKDLLNEGLERSLNKLIEKGRDKELTPEELKKAQKAIAYGCIKYADLSKDRRHEYEFSFDRMLEDKGNTAVYLLYSLSRIKSIIRKANFEEEAKIKEIVKNHKLKLEHAKEIKLAKYILKVPEIIHEVANTLLPHTLCNYIYELSAVFSEFYENCYCQDNVDRILLCVATGQVLELVFKLLGIKNIGKM